MMGLRTAGRVCHRDFGVRLAVRCCGEMNEAGCGKRREGILGLLSVAAVIAGVLAAALALFMPAAGRFPSARPTLTGLSVEVGKLCDHPGAPGHDWRWIVIHHSATAGGDAAAFERYHIGVRRWDSLAYHFVIGNGVGAEDGQIEVGPRWRAQRGGPHSAVAEYNEHGIAVCVVGDFNKRPPTELQMRSLRALVSHLMARHRIPPDAVLGHRECPGAATECPGSEFPIGPFRNSLR